MGITDINSDNNREEKNVAKVARIMMVEGRAKRGRPKKKSERMIKKHLEKLSLRRNCVRIDGSGVSVNQTPTLLKRGKGLEDDHATIYTIFY